MAACGAQAYDLNLGTNMPPVTFHGFASQVFLASDQYNYLGDTTRGSFLFTEAGLKASANPFPRTRITAQAFTYDIGEVGKYTCTESPYGNGWQWPRASRADGGSHKKWPESNSHGR